MLDRLLFLFFDVIDELILIEGKLLDCCLSKLACLANVNTALVILHLLLRFKSLLAFNSSTFKLILVLHSNIVKVHCFSCRKSRIPNFTGLHQPFYPTLIPEVGATHVLNRILSFRLWAVNIWVSKAHKENILRKTCRVFLGRTFRKSGYGQRKIELLMVCFNLGGTFFILQIQQSKLLVFRHGDF